VGYPSTIDALRGAFEVADRAPGDWLAFDPLIAAAHHVEAPLRGRTFWRFAGRWEIPANSTTPSCGTWSRPAVR